MAIVVTHTKFDPLTFEYDLALLRFHEPVSFQPIIIPVCLPPSDKKFVGNVAWVTGWGRLYEGQHSSPFLKLQYHEIFFLHESIATWDLGKQAKIIFSRRYS